MAEDGANLSEENPIKKSTESIREDEEEFYENLEAPKFVDFTAPNHHLPDDRYWFCLRVGCDQKHEEEMDSEVIYKNFVLRVMAARSPNVRLHKALNRNVSSKIMKCPLSAPPKPSKSRLPRLAIISSMSKKISNDKEKVKPQPTVGSTPKAKGKQVAAKYLTTPRNKKCPPNQSSFRSVQNPKPPTVTEPKNRTVAKALTFQSPKKVITIKTSVELRTPITKLCEGMKKLEITSQKRRVLGYSSKQLKPGGRSSQKSLLLHSSTRQKVPNKEKSRIKTSVLSHTKSNQDTKSSRFIKSKSKGNLRKNCCLQEIVANDSRTMEINVESRDDNEEHLAASTISGQGRSKDCAEEAACPESEMHPTRENLDSASTNVSKVELDNSNDSAQKIMGGNDLPRLQVSDKQNDGLEGNVQKNADTPRARCESQLLDSDDKENTSAFDENRTLNHSNNQTGREVPVIQNTNKKKVTQANDLKGSATIGAPVVKLMKPKPTNPKPFRFRTDERGILREANLERKHHAVAPQKEGDLLPRIQGGDLDGQHGDIQKESGEAAVKTPQQGQVRRKTQKLKDHSSTFQELKPSASTLEGNTLHESGNNSSKTRSSSRHLLRPQRMKAMASKMTETPSQDPKHKEVENLSEHGATTAVKPRAPAVSRTLSRGRRRLATVPKEPNFHSTHKPRSCAQKIA